MNKKNLNILIVAIIVSALLIAGGSFAFWLWTSNINKNVVFNTANLEDYIVYDEGNSYFIGNFMPTDTFCEAANTTISFYKKDGAADIPIYATIRMNINSIGKNVASSDDVYWVVTTGDNATCDGLLDSSNVLSYGTFNGKKNQESITLYTDIEVFTVAQQFTIWLWIDSAGENLSDLSGEIIDTNVWTEFMMESYEEPSSYDDHTPMITSYTCDDENGNPVTVGSTPYFTYTGQCEVIDDGNGDWRIRFLTDGDFTSTLNIPIDVFLVGGGGGGKSGKSSGGGGGGYTFTLSNYDVSKRESYSIVVGEGGIVDSPGEASSGFGHSVDGGSQGITNYGGKGGSGGGGYSANGGSNGSVGVGFGGSGQGQTTCEFDEGTFGGACDEGVQMYAGGGGGLGGAAGAGGGGAGGGGAGTDQLGGGGGSGGTGGDGIVIIRNARNIIDYEIDFEYTGLYKYIDDGNGNWRIKFLTSGIFTTNDNTNIDIFLVGGGGGGYTGSYASGGGGGTTVTILSQKVDRITSYSIVVGTGGGPDSPGEASSGFGYSAVGGSQGVYYRGGNGGSGGGGYDAKGGSNGSAGEGVGGSGQGQTTCEFDEGTLGGTCNVGVRLYAGGGSGQSSETGDGGSGGGGGVSGGGAGTGGLGGGGGGGKGGGGVGGDGIVIIRNARIDIALDFEYTGLYKYIDDGNGNWRIKFLTSGTFKTTENINVDIFLVGGGGGGYSSYYATGGGGGYTDTILNYEVNKSTDYSIVIGAGGAQKTDGEESVAFGYSVSGGIGGQSNDAGEGGSGGGGYQASGGSNGSNGSGSGAGTGQGTTTCEFGEGTFGGTCNEGVQMYAGGGSGISGGAGGAGGGGAGGAGPGTNSLGGGGGGSMDYGGAGGSGIVIIRNAR